MTKPIDIWLSIQAERARQNEKHPVTPIYFLHPENDPSIHDIKRALAEAQCDNDYLESGGEHIWANIMREELLEVFSESGDTVESLTRMREEAIQGAALYVRLIETIDEKLITIIPNERKAYRERIEKQMETMICPVCGKSDFRKYLQDNGKYTISCKECARVKGREIHRKKAENKCAINAE